MSEHTQEKPPMHRHVCALCRQRCDCTDVLDRRFPGSFDMSYCTHFCSGPRRFAQPTEPSTPSGEGREDAAEPPTVNPESVTVARAVPWTIRPTIASDRVIGVTEHGDRVYALDEGEGKERPRGDLRRKVYDEVWRVIVECEAYHHGRTPAPCDSDATTDRILALLDERPHGGQEERDG